jgi:integration host factor subunit alpha
MKIKTVIKADLAEAIYREVGLSRAESAGLVSSIFDVISGSLIAGEDVKIASFASFILREKKDRIGRNPKTGKTASDQLRQVINK